jgi:hypothetical protein
LHEKIYDTDGWLDGWKKKAPDRRAQYRVQDLIDDRTHRLSRAGGLHRHSALLLFDADVLPDQW